MSLFIHTKLIKKKKTNLCRKIINLFGKKSIIISHVLKALCVKIKKIDFQADYVNE